MSDIPNGPEIDRIDLDNLQNTYHTGELLRALGYTRDTLRYYEEIGVVSEAGQHQQLPSV